MTEEKEQDVEVEETESTSEVDLKDRVDELEKELQKRELMINLLCDEITRLEEGN